jgi:hypothetical protein
MLLIPIFHQGSLPFLLAADFFHLFHIMVAIGRADILAQQGPQTTKTSCYEYTISKSMQASRMSQICEA